jgi:uncharacterized repeat protein (TIGR01451 family)
VTVTDDIAPLLAHAAYNDDCNLGCDVTGTVLKWSGLSVAANGGSVELTFSVTLGDAFPNGTTHLPNVVVVSGMENNCESGSKDADCDTDTTVTTSGLELEKDVTEVNGSDQLSEDPDLHVPQVEVGDVVTFTLTYHGAGPIDDAVITDVLPLGYSYVAGTGLESSDGKFVFDHYDSATRTLTWKADVLLDPEADESNTVDGTIAYDVRILAGAPDRPQPLVNVATVVAHTPSGDELTDSDSAAIAILPPPEELTPPPTDTFSTPQTADSNPGFALMLILIGVAGLALGIGVLTPVPARVRRRDGRR